MQRFYYAHKEVKTCALCLSHPCRILRCRNTKGHA